MFFRADQVGCHEPAEKNLESSVTKDSHVVRVDDNVRNRLGIEDTIRHRTQK